jgi:hypothetical protein
MVRENRRARGQTAQHQHCAAPRMASKGTLDEGWFWLKECRKSVRGYEGVLGHGESSKLRDSINASQECMRPRAGTDRVCISYNEMMSDYPGVSHIYTPRLSVDFHDSCSSVCIYIERLR